MSRPPFEHFGTDAIHAGQESTQWKSRAVCPPISLSTTFSQPSPGEVSGGYDYSRGGNPTRNCLEEAFAKVTGGKFACVWGSGLAGTQACVQLLRSGDHILACDDLYGGTNRLLRRVAEPMGISFDFVPTHDAKAFCDSIKPNTKLVWIESPTNPLLQVADIAAICEGIRARQPDCIVVVDNTFQSAYFQRPLELGADIEFASVTKYYNGHSDVVMGMTATRDEAIYKRLQFIQFAAGAIPGPFDCYLVNRGLKTLHVRMEAHSKNAMAVARYLQDHDKVQEVLYPGLPQHPNHDVAVRQCTGFSGMVSFRIRGDLTAAKKFLSAVKVFTLAESLGAVESLAEHPAIMTHASVPPEQREALGISDTLIRLSVGIEDTRDLLEDVRQALAKAVPGQADLAVDDYVNIQAFHRQQGNGPQPAAPAATSTKVAFADDDVAQARTRAPPHAVAHPVSRYEAMSSSNNVRPVSASGTPVRGGALNRPPAGYVSHPQARYEGSPVRRPPGGESSFTFG